jgi:hypothetical protein
MVLGMTKKTRTLVLAALFALGLAGGVAVAGSTNLCPIHTYATCYFTGETNMGAKKYHCTCDDDVWLRR